MERHIINIEGTKALAKALSQCLEAGDILCLTGDLGAGKTTFSQFLATELGVDDYVTSPTFAILNIYQGRVPIYHFDVYRISDPEELRDIGYEEYFFGNGITIIEWANLVEDLLPVEAIWLDIKLDSDFNRVCVITTGSDIIQKKLEASCI